MKQYYKQFKDIGITITSNASTQSVI